MEKCLVSKYTKPNAIDSIKADIVRFNKIKRYAFFLIVKMGGDKPLPDGTSIHIHLKELNKGIVFTGRNGDLINPFPLVGTET